MSCNMRFQLPVKIIQAYVLLKPGIRIINKFEQPLDLRKISANDQRDLSQQALRFAVQLILFHTKAIKNILCP